MRKDTIEARITGIEREIQELRSDIRQELKSMAADLRQFQAVMIEDRMGEVEDALSQQYSQFAYDTALDQTRERLRERMTYCPPGPAREECIDHLVESHLRAGIARIDCARPEEVGGVVQSILDRDATERKSDVGTPCETCMLIYDGERDRLLAMSKKLVGYRKTLADKRCDLYFRQLPDDLVVSQIVEPLSHKARFAMLKCLTSRGTTFKELGEVTGYDGGHLVYHLNKLVSAGLAAKDEASGLYQITEKGAGVMEIVKKMYEQ